MSKPLTFNPFHGIRAYVRQSLTLTSSDITPEERAFCDAQHNKECHRMMLIYSIIIGTSLFLGLIAELLIAPQTPQHAPLFKTLPIQIAICYLMGLGFGFEGVRSRAIPFAIIMTILICSMGGIVIGSIGGFDGPYFYSVYMMPVFIVWLPCKLSLRVLATFLNITLYTLCFMSQQETFDAPGIDLTITCASLVTICASSLYHGHRHWLISSERSIAIHRLDQAHAATLAQSNKLAGRLRQQTERARVLAHEVFDAREVERVSIARNLHDDTGQLLVGAKMELELLEHKITQGKELEHAHIEHLHGVMHNLEHRIRAMIRRLHTQDQRIDLHASLHELQHSHKQITEINYDFDIIALDDLGNEATHMIYRLLQEGVTNAAKYSDGDRWKILFKKDPDNLLYVYVMDNGSHELSSEHIDEGWGIPGLKERARPLGGAVTLSRQDGWTRLELVLPGCAPLALEPKGFNHDYIAGS